jgi:hypothetical protein
MSFDEMKAHSYLQHFGTPRRQTEVVAGRPAQPATGKTLSSRSSRLIAKVFSGKKKKRARKHDQNDVNTEWNRGVIAARYSGGRSQIPL